MVISKRNARTGLVELGGVNQFCSNTVAHYVAHAAAHAQRLQCIFVETVEEFNVGQGIERPGLPCAGARGERKLSSETAANATVAVPLTRILVFGAAVFVTGIIVEGNLGLVWNKELNPGEGP